jgi:uncharacterized membrane protein YdjX (TVP38/TMEM64 family)
VERSPSPPPEPRGGARWRWLAAAGLILALILGPFAFFEAPMASMSAEWLRPGRHGAYVIAAAVALLLAADVLLPVPSSVVSAAAGYLLGPVAGAAASLAG